MTKFKAIGYGLAGAAALLISGAAQASVKVPVTLQVHVKTSFGTTFADCWSFDGAGNLTTASGLTLVYRGQNLNTSNAVFSSVTPLAFAQSLGFAIQFNGTVLGGATAGYARISGNDEVGDSYIIKGPVVTSCSSSSRSHTAALYRHP